MKTLMISTDRKIFEKDSPVAIRQVEYAKNLEELHIIIFTNKKYEETNIGNNVWVYPTRSSSKWFYPFDAIRLGRFIIKKRNIGNITCQDPFLTGMAGTSLKKEFNIPLELQLHTDIGSPNFAYKFSNRVMRFMAKSYLPKADKIRVVSNKIKDYLIKGLNIDSSKIEVRPIKVDTEKIKQTGITVNLHDKYKQFEKVVLMASRIEPEKNIELAIRSWIEVIKAVPKSGLVIVGSGLKLDTLKALVNKLGLDSSVSFEPWISRDELISYYKTADIFLNTSLFEGYGMSIVEAKSAGCKVISTDVGVARDIGCIIVDQNAISLSEALIKELK